MQRDAADVPAMRDVGREHRQRERKAGLGSESSGPVGRIGDARLDHRDAVGRERRLRVGLGHQAVAAGQRPLDDRTRRGDLGLELAGQRRWHLHQHFWLRWKFITCRKALTALDGVS
ncbi:MAG: hypothetical protein M5U30_18825 [Burkholderiaceae bacterium]|nr:hypothetical protein [Burkholderiaceae bacterium]